MQSEDVNFHTIKNPEENSSGFFMDRFFINRYIERHEAYISLEGSHLTEIFLFVFPLHIASYPKKLRSTPAATAEPITPATFGPMACIRR